MHEPLTAAGWRPIAARIGWRPLLRIAGSLALLAAGFPAWLVWERRHLSAPLPAWLRRLRVELTTGATLALAAGAAAGLV